MQLLANESTEHGKNEGLSWIQGRVNKMQSARNYKSTYGLEFCTLF